jgi:hypothetical protein
MNLNLPKDCEHYTRCGDTGHFVNEKKEVERCPCMERKLNRIYLKEFDCADPNRKTPLGDEILNNALLTGTHEDVIWHTAGALLLLRDLELSWVSITSERLLEIWLDKDEDGLRTFVPLERADLVFLWLGWGDTLPNRCRPDAIDDLISRRARVQKPLWIYMNFDLAEAGKHFNSVALQRKLGEFPKVNLAILE